MIHAGAGNDMITGGPSSISDLSTTTVTVTGYGTVVGGVGGVLCAGGGAGAVDHPHVIAADGVYYFE